jgi:hypothetical protein
MFLDMQFCRFMMGTVHGGIDVFPVEGFTGSPDYRDFLGTSRNDAVKSLNF